VPPDARLARKADGQEARLAYAGHLLIENRSGLTVDARLMQATGTAEPAAALGMLQARPGRHKTVGADMMIAVPIARETQGTGQIGRVVNVVVHRRLAETDGLEDTSRGSVWGIE
jgi:hypothetical protein